MSSRRRRPGRTATLSPLRSQTGASPPGSRRAPRPLVPCPARHPARSARPSTCSSPCPELLDLRREFACFAADDVGALTVATVHALPHVDQVLHVLVVAALAFYRVGDGADELRVERGHDRTPYSRAARSASVSLSPTSATSPSTPSVGATSATSARSEEH